jgi:hypothetical protein
MFMHIIFKYKLNFVLRDINMSNHGEPFHSCGWTYRNDIVFDKVSIKLYLQVLYKGDVVAS